MQHINPVKEHGQTKTITVVFAASTENTLTAADRIQLEIWPNFNDGNPVPEALKGVSVQHETGKFYTLKYTIPTQDQMVAAGIDQYTASQWLNNTGPSVLIVNQSATSDPNPSILIDKVTFGY